MILEQPISNHSNNPLQKRDSKKVVKQLNRQKPPVKKEVQQVNSEINNDLSRGSKENHGFSINSNENYDFDHNILPSNSSKGLNQNLLNNNGKTSSNLFRRLGAFHEHVFNSFYLVLPLNIPSKFSLRVQ